jgi:hypothetical protein
MPEKEDNAALDRKQREEPPQHQDGKTIALAADRDEDGDKDFAARPLPKRSSPAG